MYPEINKKLVILLLLGYSLSAQAASHHELTLKLDSKLNSFVVDLKSASAQKKHAQLIQTSSKDSARPAPLKLKLSGHSIDESGFANISTKPNEVALDNQKSDDKGSELASSANTPLPFQPQSIVNQSTLVESDTPAASSLLLKETAVPELISTAISSPASFVAANTLVSEISSKPLMQEAINQNILDEQNQNIQDERNQNILFATFTLIIGMVLAGIGIRYYRKFITSGLLTEINPQQNLDVLQQNTAPCIKSVEDVLPTPQQEISPISTSSFRISKRRRVPAILASIKLRTIKSEVPVSPLPSQIVEKEVQENSVPEKVATQQHVQNILQSIDVRNEIKANAQSLLQDEVLLQDEDNFFADFNPKRNGSVSEFLASRNSVTIEQLIGWARCRPATRQLELRIVGTPSMQM